ncbi:MAG: DUF4129 domain-containing protein [Caldilineae bacterium]|nr:MAG: DUF4129 domain-containing protein [Caldilineae bacterium]
MNPRDLLRAIQRTCSIGAFALVLLGLTGFYASAQPGEPPLSLDAYRARLSQAVEELDRTGDVAAAQAVLESVTHVRLPDGELIAVQPFLQNGIAPEIAQARLLAAIIQLRLAEEDHTEERLGQLEQVLDRLALDEPTLWERFTRWLRELWERLWPNRRASEGGPLAAFLARLLDWIILLAAVTLTAILLSYWLRQFLGGMLLDREVRRRQADGEPVPLTAREARRMASEQAQVGNYREAVRQLYLAALLHLDERGLIRYDPSLTNREVLAQTKPGAPVRVHLQPVVDVFDRVWYGIREPDRATYEHYRQEIDALMATSGSTEGEEDHGESV